MSEPETTKTVPLHPDVERLTTESTICTFCVASGGLPEGLLSGFYWGVHAAREGAVALCFEHRVQLAFYFDLAERIGLLVKKKGLP